MTNTLVTIIVPVNLVNQARELATSVSSAGEGMFITPLASSENDVPTHYISSGYIDAEFAYLMYNYGALYAVASFNNPELKTTLEETKQLIETSFVSYTEAFSFMEEKQLRMINISNT